MPRSRRATRPWRHAWAPVPDFQHLPVQVVFQVGGLVAELGGRGVDGFGVDVLESSDEASDPATGIVEGVGAGIVERLLSMARCLGGVVDFAQGDGAAVSVIWTGLAGAAFRRAVLEKLQDCCWSCVSKRCVAPGQGRLAKLLAIDNGKPPSGAATRILRMSGGFPEC